MDRTAVRRIEQPRSKKTLNGLLMAAVAVVLLFALVGVISTGAFVAGKVAGGSSTPTKLRKQSAASSHQVTLARAEATAIVRDAQTTGRTIVNRATNRAHRQATSILSQARRQAAHQSASSASAPIAPAAAAPAPAVAAPAPTFAAPATSPYVAQSAPLATAMPAPSVGTAATGTQANLSGLPAGWLVVGYNATFGSGPGSAGSITVTNRGNTTFSGAAEVVYARGGAASASFAGLAPGQTLVLPLNGSAYRGGGYKIVVSPH